MKKKNGNNIIIIIILFIIVLILTFKIINKKATPTYMKVAESESKKFATLVINDAVNKNVNKDLSTKLLKETSNSKGDITSLEFDTISVNKVLTTITKNVLISLKKIEEGDIKSLDLSDEIIDTYKRKNLEKGIIYRIPTGIAFNNSLLTNLGPKIPVKLNFIGDIESNIKTKAENYGINNSLLEVYVELKVDIQVVLPLMSKNTKIITNVPIIIKSVQGSIPNFFSSSNNPSISIPID